MNECFESSSTFLYKGVWFSRQKDGSVSIATEKERRPLAVFAENEWVDVLKKLAWPDYKIGVVNRPSLDYRLTEVLTRRPKDDLVVIEWNGVLGCGHPFASAKILRGITHWDQLTHATQDAALDGWRTCVNYRFRNETCEECKK